jgi:hypothetical protein
MENPKNALLYAQVKVEKYKCIGKLFFSQCLLGDKRMTSFKDANILIDNEITADYLQALKKKS